MRIGNEIVDSALLMETLKSISLKLMELNKQSTIDESGLIKLKQHFTCKLIQQTPEKIYSECFYDFFLKYGYSNIIKNYFVISELSALNLLSSNSHIIDIGSGPGILDLAFLIWYGEDPINRSIPREIVLHDCSKESLRFFQELWEKLDSPITGRFNNKIVNDLFIGEFPLELQEPTMVFMSNSLGEMLRDSRVNISGFLTSLKRIKPVVVIIDYAYDSMQNNFDAFFNELRKDFIDITAFSWPRSKVKLQSIDLHKINFAISPEQRLSSNVKFIKGIFVPKTDANQIKISIETQIVSLYKRAWETHDLNILRDIFDKEAQYSIGTHRPVLNGIKEIEDYWMEGKSEQQYVHFSPRFISRKADNVYCDWISLFYRIDYQKWMLLDGSFEITLKQEKILKFKETFRKQISESKPNIFDLIEYPSA